ncbi:hypothetical protein J2S49_001800 [Arcanobacterium wilhelmae]|uniref:Uncharacterized protein n=1 Tax=Arcanobacterium wilhelmae TaxID=1803177 RepID=A0ABT9NDE3_9ACTO|nr:hypothetical protein [Arcanobacterium wilhelmae]MDP9801724.1 hypothetical protein [Arcanobacterium wilhelmae]WFN91042.1 hypothetical protein P8A24_04100 [Arcanobacterium wilhelmae]
MNVNDVAMFSLVGVFFLVVIGGIVFSFLGKNKGHWDERSRVRGQMRKRGWKVADTVGDIAKFFAVNDRYTLMDRALAPDVPGLMAVEGKSGETEWKTAVTISPDDGAQLLVSATLAQRPDGSIGALDEARLDRTDGGFAIFSDQGEASWLADGTESGQFPPYLTHDLLDWLYRWESAEAVHFAGEQVTARLTPEASRRDLVELVDESSRAIGTTIGLLPPIAWA